MNKNNKMTIQVCLTTIDLEFLGKVSEKHGLKNNSEAVRTIISRYKGMEDWILKRRESEGSIRDIKKSKVIVE